MSDAVEGVNIAVKSSPDGQHTMIIIQLPLPSVGLETWRIAAVSVANAIAPLRPALISLE